jgi:predicted RNA-binding protein with PIN domain
MRYLIDGYNLLHALGWAPKRPRPQSLEKARLGLLNRLACRDGDPAEVTVVFDARGAPAGAGGDQSHRGIRVIFARGQEADDVIEDHIAGERQPHSLTVVSDDRRLRRAARRHGCQEMGCVDFIESLQRPAANPSQPPPSRPPKPEAASPEEVEHWLREFADLAEDPRIGRELNWGFSPDEEGG